MTKKLHQFKNITVPGVLAIASSHFGSSILMDSQSAMHALISQPFRVVGKEGMSTDLNIRSSFAARTRASALRTPTYQPSCLSRSVPTEATSAGHSIQRPIVDSIQRRCGRCPSLI